MKTINSQTKSLLAGIPVLAFAIFFITPKLFSNKAEPVAGKTAAAPSADNKAPTDVAAMDVAPTDVVATDIFVVKRETITDELQSTGTIAANQEVDLVSEVARKLVRVYAREGSFVNQGTLLYKLDDADLLAKKRRLAFRKNWLSWMKNDSVNFWPPKRSISRNTTRC